jgi:NAD(P)H-dependent flavin oxidoreductase YrpB (nitropropane dioxygenase family)
MLGAAGVNVGTRFITSLESPASASWKHAIVCAKPEDSFKAEVLNDITPLPGTTGFGTVLRSLHTAFLDEWSTKREEARRESEHLRDEVFITHQRGRQHDTLLTAGQTAGGINDVLPVAEVMRRLIAETESALARSPAYAPTAA